MTMAGESAATVSRRRREKAERLIASADRYDQGAEGERRTAEALAALPPDWMVLHDVAWPGRARANIDHVVVGPGGVFVVDSKLWSGQVVVSDGVLRQNRRKRATATDGVLRATGAVAGLLPPELRVAVSAVISMCGAAAEGRAGGVLVTPVERLVENLTSRPLVLSTERRGSVARVLQARLTPADAPRPAAVPPPAPPRSAEPVAAPRAPRRRTSSVRPSTLVALVAALAFLAVQLLQPQLITGAADWVADRVTSVVWPETEPDPVPAPTSERRQGADRPDRARSRERRQNG